MRTKIIATIGPKSESRETIGRMVADGLDIARFNFSHCTPEEFETRTARLREASAEHGREVLILQDLQGPRIRVGILPPEGVQLIQGAEIVFSTREKDPGAIFVDHADLASDVKAGEPIYLANGEMEVEVRETNGERIRTEVIRGGILYSRKALNLPHTRLSVSGLTKKDISAVEYGLARGVDYVAISFVQTAADVHRLREIAGTRARIVAKIESAVALRHIDEIIQASDAIMIARGDLGIEIPAEQVPFIQKNLIRHAAWHGKGAIVATQMLTSMVNHPRPTRAEVSDIANAVWDGADAVMLSDETAEGKYPLETLRAMVRIVGQAEEYRFHQENPLARTASSPV